MKILFKVLGFLFTVLFVLGAIVQYNDPDALRWIAIWGVAAIISLLFALDKISFAIPMGAAILALAGFFYNYPAQFEGFEIGAGNIKNIEEGREAFGLLIIFMVMLVFSLRIRFGKKS